MDVLTNRYNSARTGANLNETVLNQDNVNVNAFGKLFSRGVDGQIYAQPLIVSNLNIPGVGLRTVVFVATTRNMVYAFDAKNAEACHPIWRVDLDGSKAIPVPRTDYGGYQDFTSEIGVTSTPVIDRESETIYLTSKSKELAGGKPHYLYKLHALSLAAGAAKFGSPATIAETVVNDLLDPSGNPKPGGQPADFTFIRGPSAKGTGAGNENGNITFNAFYQLQRPGLLLQDGAIYLGFASHGDNGPYHGWVLAYDAHTLALLGAYCTTPDWSEGGVWQSGCGVAGDGAGNVYAVCGNGKPFPDGFGGPALAAQMSKGPFFGQSVLKLRLDRAKKQFQLEDWFVTKDIVSDNHDDVDFCAGPVLLPWSNLMGAWGKDLAYYIMDRNSLGRFNLLSNNIHQYARDMTKAQALRKDGGTGHIHCAPVVFEDPIVGPVSYVWGENDSLRGYPFDSHNSQFQTQTPPNLLSTNVLRIGMPGGMLSISSDGEGPGAQKTAVLWALHPTAGNANHQTVAGTLQAYKADDLRQSIWSSNHDPRGTDDLGEFAKFCPPVIANGRVYVATFSQQLVVYGLLTEGSGLPIGDWIQEDIPVQSSGDRTFRVEGTASFSCGRFTILGAGADIWDPSDAFHFVYKPTLNGSIEITARVVSVQNTDPWAKAGVMIRESLDADSAHAMVIVTPGNGAAFQHRPSKGAPSIHMPFTRQVEAPFWVRVIRAPSGPNFQFDGFVSTDGTKWEQVGSSVTIPFGGNALAGMAVTAHTSTHGNPLQDLCVSTIDRVSLT
jgi:hypothetical protein